MPINATVHLYYNKQEHSGERSMCNETVEMEFNLLSLHARPKLVSEGEQIRGASGSLAD